MTRLRSIQALLIINLALIIFHTGVIMGWVPENVVWGGRDYEDHQILILQGVSMFVTLFLIFILLIEGGYFRQIISPKITRIVLWVFFVYFLLNTVGNFLSQTIFEKSMAILTLIMAYLLWRVVKK